MPDTLESSRPSWPHNLAELSRLADDELMFYLKSGCDDALAILYDRYHRLIFSIALRIVRDRGEAEDVMQNVFLKIFRSVTKFDPSKGSTEVWLLQYAYHRAINRRAYLTARGFYSQEQEEYLEQALAEVPQKLTAVELGHLLDQGLATLSKPQRRVIELAALGAGKTTLLNRILNGKHGLCVAVLVNNFGSVNIDAELVVGVEDDPVSLSNGCVCCSIRDDLVEAVTRVLERPERCLLEQKFSACIARPMEQGQLSNSFQPIPRVD